MYNVFTDFHHASLLNSFILLFEKRLGGNVYRPIGKEWFEQGFWKVYDHPATVEQFLGVGGATPDGTAPLNEVVKRVRGLYHCRDIEGHKTNKAITLSTFYEMNIDIVIASLPYHIEPFKKLCQLHPNKPKLIYQIGNAWVVEAGLAPNIMASAKIADVPEGINFIQYHQEFDTDIFHPDIPTGNKNIYSFVNVFNGLSHFNHDWSLFTQMESEMLDWNFKSYGGQCRDGSMGGSQALADKMREAKFIWHTKAGGDGYGHVLYNSAAVGRPTIVKKSYYEGKMGEELLIDGVTCIDIDNLSIGEIKAKIEHYSEAGLYAQMCGNVYDNFTKYVKFDLEAIRLKVFLENLK